VVPWPQLDNPYTPNAFTAAALETAEADKPGDSLLFVWCVETRMVHGAETVREQRKGVMFQ
jgi:hypothetical protein